MSKLKQNIILVQNILSFWNFTTILATLENLSVNTILGNKLENVHIFCSVSFDQTTWDGWAFFIEPIRKPQGSP